MKKIFTFIVLSMLAIGAKAQSFETGTRLPTGKSWEDKHFREALEKGREAKSYYELVNEDKKVIKVESLTDFCRTHNYMWKKNYETKEIAKFGDLATSVYKFYFLPEEEYVYYVFEWTDRSMARASDLKNKGSVYFFDADANAFICLRDNALWTGTVSGDLVSGTGAGIWKKNDDIYYYFQGTFKNGFPVGKAKFRIVDTNKDNWGFSPRETSNGSGIPFREVELGEMQDGMALFRYLDNGEKRQQGNELWGYVTDGGTIAIKQQYKTAYAFSNGRAAVVNDKGEDIYINKTGQFVDYTEKQQKIFADAKAKEDAEKAEQERQRMLAEQKAEEERRIAEEKRLAYLQKIQPLMDKSKWERGDRICLEFGRQGQYITGTLEEWNGNKSKCRIKIVTSPNGNMSYNGDILSKNNLIWIPTSGEGWHKALPEEIEAANLQDNSIPTTTISQMVICPECHGKKYKEESYSTYFFGIPTGTSTRTVKCSRCDGTGFSMETQHIKNF